VNGIPTGDNMVTHPNKKSDKKTKKSWRLLVVFVMCTVPTFGCYQHQMSFKVTENCVNPQPPSRVLIPKLNDKIRCQGKEEAQMQLLPLNFAAMFPKPHHQYTQKYLRLQYSLGYRFPPSRLLMSWPWHKVSNMAND
jgi:hypothetical protein